MNGVLQPKMETLLTTWKLQSIYFLQQWSLLYLDKMYENIVTERVLLEARSKLIVQ